jgi:serine/threonine protein kinase/formylglycine-generating enzyme required for sulfatase activity
VSTTPPSEPASGGPSPLQPPEARPDLAVFEVSGVMGGSPLVGRVIAGRYELCSELGRGGMGVVYLALDREAGRRVALKMLMGSAARSPDMRLRFAREAETASRIQHPGICGVRAFGEFEGLPYLVMDFIEGTTLDAVIEKARAAAAKAEEPAASGTPATPPPPEDPARTFVIAPPRPDTRSRARARADAASSRSSVVEVDHMVRLVEQVGRALHVAHELGLIHRDIKPANIMVTPAGDPVLLDFGLARDLTVQGQTLTESGQIVGTPAYLAPEQVKGDRAAVDRRTDVYALGVTLYECLTLERPIRGDTRDQLFHDILTGQWTPPRRLNPRIPPDLAIVVEKAMDREPTRRYESAQAFAEDLKRVRGFEPIQARRPPPWVRLRRWIGRRPARAAALAGTAALLLAAATLAIHQTLVRSAARTGKLAEVERLLLAGLHTEALEALAQARELGLDENRDLALRARIEDAREAAAAAERRAADLAAAAHAREESSAMQIRHQELLSEIDALRSALEGARTAVFAAAASEQERGRFAEAERTLRAREAEADRLLREAYEALERAARQESPWGPPSSATREAFASWHLARWREALSARDPDRAAWFREAVERHDPLGRHRAELDGLGTLVLPRTPPGTAIHLFRYEPYETLRADHPVPRLVPVPTAGRGRLRDGAWSSGFFPGDPAWLVLEVEHGSWADRAGIQGGDLVVGIDGEPAGEGPFVREMRPEATVEPGLVVSGRRILALNESPVESRYDWLTAPPRPDGGPDEIRLSGIPSPLRIPRTDVAVVTARALIEGPAPRALRITALRGGEPVDLQVAAGEASGLRVELTAYPLILHPGNRMAGGAELTVDPGSYLLLVRGPDGATLRVPFVVDRGGRTEPALPATLPGSIPPGFLLVPGGAFVAGGDPRAVHATQAETVELPDFLIARYEVTNREWFEFVNDPSTLAAIASSGTPRLLPREPTRVLAVRREDGSGWTWGGGGPETPVLGVSWHDAQEYLAWWNRRSEAADSPWRAELPTLAEWEKAARGADGRAFPWGDRFDFALAVSAHRKATFLHEAPRGFEARDESPYGVRDLAGSRQEWTKERFHASDPLAPPAYHLKGGSWGSAVPDLFRSAGRGYSDANFVGGSTGLRLVLRPRA